MPAPSNDNIANRIVLSGDAGSITPVTIDDATVEVGEPVGSDIVAANQSVWYEWTAAADGLATFTTQGSVATDGNGDSHGGLDTTLAVWTGDPTDYTTLVEAASDDDDSTLGSGHFTSRVRFAVTAGTTYLIQIGTYDTPYTGVLHMGWSRVDLTLIGPGNDACANAYELVGTSGHVEATNIGWAGSWPAGADPLFNKYGHGGGAPLWFKYVNAGATPVQLLVVPTPGAVSPVVFIQEGLAVGTCGTLDVDAGDGFFVRSRNHVDPGLSTGSKQIDVIIPAGETAYLELDSYTGDGSEPPDASAAEGGFAFDWTIAPVSTQDCMTDQLALADTRATQQSMNQMYSACIAPATGGIGGDGTQPMDSILVGDKVYVAYQLDWFETMDPYPSCAGHTPHRSMRVASVNTDGTGYTEAVVFDTPARGYGHGATKGVTAGSEGNLTGGSGGSTNSGSMVLAYDGHDVLVAILTVTGAFSGQLNYYVDIYREDGGAWTNIATVVTEDMNFDELRFDCFESFRIAASPTGPRKLWVGLIYAYVDNNTGLYTDRFTRYEIDTSTGATTTLYDDFDDAGGTATAIEQVSAVGTAHWWIEADEGYPILLWQKHSGFEPEFPDDSTPAFNGRFGWDGFLTAERFDTKAAISTIHRSAFSIPTADGFDGTGTPAVSDDMPLGHGANEQAFQEIRTGDTLKMFGRFFCDETGQYERFISLRGWADFYDSDGNLEADVRSIARFKSDLTGPLHQIDALTFNRVPSINANSGFSFSQRNPWAVTTPLYDGERNVWTAGDSLAHGAVMMQYDRRCAHVWLDSLHSSGGWDGDLWQRGGWDADLYFYLLGVDMQIWKLGPILRDCINCIPIVPLISGLFAHVII